MAWNRMSDKKFTKTVRYLAYLPWPVSEESAESSCMMGLGWRLKRSSGLETGAGLDGLARMSAQHDGELATIEVPLIDAADDAGGEVTSDWVRFQAEARAAYISIGEGIFGPVQQVETLDGGTADSWLLKSGASVSIIATPESMFLKVASPREGRAELARQVATP